MRPGIKERVKQGLESPGDILADSWHLLNPRITAWLLRTSTQLRYERAVRAAAARTAKETAKCTK